MCLQGDLCNKHPGLQESLNSCGQGLKTVDQGDADVENSVLPLSQNDDQQQIEMGNNSASYLSLQFGLVLTVLSMIIYY